MAIEIKTGVGRIVWGNPAKVQIKKQQNGPNKGQPVLNKEGKPTEQWVFGVAFPKAEFGPIWAAMAAEAATAYPPSQQNPQGVPPKFSWKYKDGDGLDDQGKPFNTREGYAGHYILTVSTEAFAPPIYKFVNGTYVQLPPDQIKTGDYVVCALNIKVNVPPDRSFTPGLFINPIAIEHVAYGTPIVNGPDPTQLFGQGGGQYQLPPGASVTPLAPSGNIGMPGTGGPQMQPQGGPGGYQPQPGGPISSGPMPGQTPMPGQPQMQPQQPMMQQPGYPPQQPQMQYAPQQPMMQPQPTPVQQYQQQPGYIPVQPAHDFVQNAGQQQPMQYAPQPGQPQMQYAPQQPQQQPMQYAPQPGQPQMQPQQPYGQPGMMPPNR